MVAVVPTDHANHLILSLPPYFRQIPEPVCMHLQWTWYAIRERPAVCKPISNMMHAKTRHTHSGTLHDFALAELFGLVHHSSVHCKVRQGKVGERQHYAALAQHALLCHHGVGSSITIHSSRLSPILPPRLPPPSRTTMAIHCQVSFGSTANAAVA